jgi:predicted nucleotidyltransferase
VNTVEGYLKHAEECERLAKSSRTEEERQQILHMAQTWRMLAERKMGVTGNRLTRTHRRIVVESKGSRDARKMSCYRRAENGPTTRAPR